VLYFTAGSELGALSLRTGRVIQRIPLVEAGQPILYGGVRLFGSSMAWLSGPETVLLHAQQGSTVGIATFDPAKRRVEAFRPLRAFGLSSCSTGTAVASIRIGQLPDGRPRFSTVLLSPSSLATLDSITAPAEYQSIIPTGDCGTGYSIGPGLLALYSIAAHQITVEKPIQTPGYVAVAPDRKRLALSDAGIGLDFPGSGRVFVYDDSLSLVKAIDLAPIATTVFPVATNLLAWSHDDRWLWVSAGSSPATLYPAQQAQVVLIDGQSFELVGSIRFNHWSGVWLFPLR